MCGYLYTCECIGMVHLIIYLYTCECICVVQLIIYLYTCECICVVQLILLGIITSNTNHKAPYYVVSPLPCYLVALRPKYSPQHPILLLLQGVGTSFFPHVKLLFLF